MPFRFAFVFCLDQISPLAFPGYGHFFREYPEIDQLANRGLVFHEHYSQRSQMEEFLTAWETRAASLSANISIHIVRSAPQHSPATENSLESVLTHALSQAQADPEQKHQALFWFCLEEDLLSDDEKLSLLNQQIGDCQKVLQEFSESAGQQAAEFLWIITAASGSTPATADDDADSALMNQVSNSLSVQQWVPLIVCPVPCLSNYGQHCSNLTTVIDLPVTLAEWFQIPHETLAMSTGIVLLNSPVIEEQTQRQLLLIDEQRIGLRTTSDFLVVNRTSHSTSADSEALPPQDARYYLKPEDRFDSNDCAVSYPENVRQRWQTIQTLKQ